MLMQSAYRYIGKFANASSWHWYWYHFWLTNTTAKGQTNRINVLEFICLSLNLVELNSKSSVCLRPELVVLVTFDGLTNGLNLIKFVCLSLNLVELTANSSRHSAPATLLSLHLGVVSSRFPATISHRFNCSKVDMRSTTVSYYNSSMIKVFSRLVWSLR
jgi:hypothetical protein